LEAEPEAADGADLGRDRVGEHPADTGDCEQQGDVGVLGAEPAQLGLAGGDLLVEQVEQAQARLHAAGPRLRQRQPLQQRAAGGAEEIGDGAGLSVREQHGVHALLESGAVADEMEPEASALPLRAHRWVGQPDRRDELAARELGQHPGIDPVGLAGQGRQALHLERIRDLHLPAA
jgi:hypothetical protein